jgi:long-chain fatty acid transport protein
MRKAASFLFIFGIILLSVEAFAGSIDYLSNQSAEYVMNFSRNAATDSADAAVYNPAGLAFLPRDGLYLNASLQYIDKPMSETFMNVRYEQNEPSYVPNLYTVYKKDRLAAFFAFSVTAGGGKAKWTDGSATTAPLISQIGGAIAGGFELLNPGLGGSGTTSVNDQWIEGDSSYVGLMPGVAYKINDNVSASLAVRYIISERSAAAFADFNVDAVLDAVGPVYEGNETRVIIDDKFEYKANGIGAVIGLDIKPLDNLLFGIRYETVTKLDFEYDMKRRSATVNGVSNPLLESQLAALDKDGKKLRRDLPAVLGIGMDLTVIPGFDLLSSFNYYFIENAVWEDARIDGRDYHNGWEISLGATYRVIPPLKIGAGFLYTISGETDDTPYVNENPNLNSRGAAVGFTYTFTPNLDVTLAAEHTWYVTDSVNEGTPFEIEYKRHVNNIALGIQYRFDM